MHWDEIATCDQSLNGPPRASKVIRGLLDRKEQPRGVVNLRVVAHEDREPQRTRRQQYGDDRRPGVRLREEVPEACGRLDEFGWEWVRENDVVYDEETDELVRFGAEFVAFHEHPVSCTYGLNRNGLAEAAGEVARWVQAELHARSDEPLVHGDAIDLWMLRLRYVNALYWLAGDRHTGWKELEASISPDGVPRSICIGSGEEVPVQVIYFGRGMPDTMHGYRGCLRTFHVKPHGRGRPWATWCPACSEGGRKSNHRERAKREYQRRIAEMGRSRS